MTDFIDEFNSEADVLGGAHGPTLRRTTESLDPRRAISYTFNVLSQASQEAIVSVNSILPIQRRRAAIQCSPHYPPTDRQRRQLLHFFFPPHSVGGHLISPKGWKTGVGFDMGSDSFNSLSGGRAQ